MTTGPGKGYATRRRTGPATRIAPARRSARAFTEDEILVAIARWHHTYGETPKMIDWEPSRARREGQTWRAERFEEGQWPSVRMVCRAFESFSAAVRAAGLTPRSGPSRTRPNLTGPESITEAFLEWTRRYGDVPTMADWDPARARRVGQDWRIARYHDGDWPSARTVAEHFGSFANAAQAAGLVPRLHGVHHDARTAERAANRLTAARATHDDRPAGAERIRRHVLALAQARRDQDPTSAHAALIDLAGAALAWAEVLDTDQGEAADDNA